MGRTDAELIAAARAGDTAAFGLIVARYQPAVVAVAYAAVRDRVLAEDIAQDAFVTAWTKLAGLRDIERLPAWLCGIARNVARARRRVRGRELPEVDVAAEPTPFTELDDAQREAALAAALARVPATYREPLVLVYCEQQSAHEVARALGVSDAAVHQRLSRGRTMLAGDAQLVEHAGRRSRRDLAAAVLAAIAIGFGSSRVDASPRGRPMLKLAALALTASIAAGTTYAVTHVGTSSASPTPTATAAPPPGTAPAPQARRVGAHPWFAAPASPTIVARTGSAGPVTCAEVARHMASLSFDGAVDPPPPMVRVDEALGFVEKHFKEKCEQGHWSQDYMGCVLGSPDSYSQMFDCMAYAPVEIGEDPTAQQPEGQYVFASRTDPIPPTTDTSCAGVAKHMADLTRPDPASLAKLSPDMRDRIENAMAEAQTAMIAQAAQGCTDTAWTDARRTCLAAATTATEMTACN